MNLTLDQLDTVIAAAKGNSIRQREILRHFRPDGSGIKITGENVPAWIILTVTKPALYACTSKLEPTTLSTKPPTLRQWLWQMLKRHLVS